MPLKRSPNKRKNYITENYYTCIAGLGQMCVAGERFKNNIDKHAYHSKNCPKKERKAPCHTPEKFGTIENDEASEHRSPL